jgi:hypothetical protein
MRLPRKSFTERIGECGFTAQTNSPTVSTLSLTMCRSAPCWIAATAPARSTSA